MEKLLLIFMIVFMIMGIVGAILLIVLKNDDFRKPMIKNILHIVLTILVFGAIMIGIIQLLK